MDWRWDLQSHSEPLRFCQTLRFVVSQITVHRATMILPIRTCVCRIQDTRHAIILKYTCCISWLGLISNILVFWVDFFFFWLVLLTSWVTWKKKVFFCMKKAYCIQMNGYFWRTFGVVTCLFSRKDRFGFLWCSDLLLVLELEVVPNIEIICVAKFRR